MYLLSLSLPPSATSIKIRSFLRPTTSSGDFLLRLLRVVPSDNSRQSVPCEKCLQTHWGRNREPPWPAAMLFRSCAQGGAVVAPRFVASWRGGAVAGPCAGSLSAALMAPHRGQPPAASGAPPPCPPRAPRAAGISPWPSLSYSCVQGLIPPELLGSEPHAAAFPEPSLISGENDLSALLPTSRIGPRLRHHAPRGAAWSPRPPRRCVVAAPRGPRPRGRRVRLVLRLLPPSAPLPLSPCPRSRETVLRGLGEWARGSPRAQKGNVRGVRSLAAPFVGGLGHGELRLLVFSSIAWRSVWRETS